jgi:hypothetical protein
MDPVIGLVMGADDYSTKPFSMRELSAALPQAKVDGTRLELLAGSLGGLIVAIVGGWNVTRRDVL